VTINVSTSAASGNTQLDYYPWFDDAWGDSHSFQPTYSEWLEWREQDAEAESRRRATVAESERLARRFRKHGDKHLAETLFLPAFRLGCLTDTSPPPLLIQLDHPTGPLAPLGRAGTLFGPGGIGKSFVLLEWGCAVAKAAFTRKDQPGPLGCTIRADAAGAAIFLTMEDDADEIRRRIADLYPAGFLKKAPIFIIPTIELPDFDTGMVTEEGRQAKLLSFAKKGLPTLMQRIERECGYPVRWVAIDPAGDTIQGDEDDAMLVKPLMRRVGDIAKAANSVIVLGGHTPKNNHRTMRGSGAWEYNGRFSIGLHYGATRNGRRLEPKKTPDDRLVIECELTKANHRGAPVGLSFPLVRNPDGRLVPWVPAKAEKKPADGAKADAEPDHLGQLVRACIAFSEACKPFTMSGPKGVFQRKKDLPTPLSEWRRDKLEALVQTAIEKELLERDKGGFLHAPGAAKGAY